MSWWLGTCCLVPSSALQQRTPEKLLSLLCLSFPCGKRRLWHCSSWRWGSELNIPEGTHVGAARSSCEEGSRTGHSYGVPVTGRGAAGSRDGERCRVPPSARGGLITHRPGWR